MTRALSARTSDDMAPALEHFGLAEKEGDVEGSLDVQSDPGSTFGLDTGLLPERGRFLGARYRLALAIDDESDDERPDGPRTTTTELTVERAADAEFLRFRSPSEDGILGYATLDSFESRWMAAIGGGPPPAGETPATLAVTYDPGLTRTATSRPAEVEAHDLDVGFVTYFPNAGATVDYRGRFTTRDATLRFPMGVDRVLPIGDDLLVLFDPDASGVDDADVETPAGRNLRRVSPAAETVWTVAGVENGGDAPSPHRRIWRYDDRLVTERRTDDGVLYHAVDSETGAVTETIPRHQ